MGSKIKYEVIEWLDSYGATNGWIEIEGYEPEPLLCISFGVKVYENEKVVALAPNYAASTTYTPNQANGLMVIPKSCIQKTTTFSYSDAGLKQKRQAVVEEYELERLYDWVMDEKREKAQTKFTSGVLRNVAKEIEYRLSQPSFSLQQVEDEIWKDFRRCFDDYYGMGNKTRDELREWVYRFLVGQFRPPQQQTDSLGVDGAKRKIRELVEATLIIGARRGDGLRTLNHDSAKELINQHIDSLTERFYSLLSYTTPPDTV